jgi:hypothetical protein
LEAVMMIPFHIALIGLMMARGVVPVVPAPDKLTGLGAGNNAARPSGPVPVLVELFTSEGCSSCPPADALLAKLDATQFVPGAQVIVLSEHVTYWNQDGWHDPFSLDAMTDRQARYVERFGLQSSYTPEAVVDGAAQMVGSDQGKLAQAVAQAAAAPKQALAIQDAQWSGGAVKFAVKGAADSKTELVAALAEDSAQSSVAKGENAGRNLKHVAVVRVMEEMGKGADDGRALTLKAPAGNKQGSSSGQTGPMRLVVFVVDRHNGHVLAAAERTISRS